MNDAWSCEWFFSQATQVLPPEDSLRVHLRIIQLEWQRMSDRMQGYFILLHTMPCSSEYPHFDLDADLLYLIQTGQGNLLYYTIYRCFRSCDSFTLGGILVEWLLNAGIDVEEWMSHEMKRWNIQHMFTRMGFAKKMVLEICKDGGWRLGFEYVFDSEASGYLVVAEYQALSVEPIIETDWPFYDLWSKFYDWSRRGSLCGQEASDEYEKYLEPKRRKRFERRTAAKQRKERARTGQKIPKSRIPGTWVWWSNSIHSFICI